MHRDCQGYARRFEIAHGLWRKKAGACRCRPVAGRQASVIGACGEVAKTWLCSPVLPPDRPEDAGSSRGVVPGGCSRSGF